MNWVIRDVGRKINSIFQKSSPENRETLKKNTLMQWLNNCDIFDAETKCVYKEKTPLWSSKNYLCIVCFFILREGH